VFALLVLIAIAGVTLNFVLRQVEARLCFWSGKATK
jgi:ABC-type nitrate/sulfonate/bicarbonate transport system permease component